MNGNMPLSRKPPGSNAQSAFLCPEVLRIIEDSWQVRNDKIIRLPVLCSTVGKAAPTLWKDIKVGTFPPPISLGPRAVGWKESEVSAWISVRQLATRKGIDVDMRLFVSVLIEPPSHRGDAKVGARDA